MRSTRESVVLRRQPSISTGMLTLLWVAVSAHAAASQPFTVAEEIGLAHFGDPYGGEAEAVQFSPDGQYFAALTERGRLDLDRPEDTLRIYRAQDVLTFLRRSNDSHPPSPLWAFNRSSDRDGPLITHWRWLKDSTAGIRCRGLQPCLSFDSLPQPLTVREDFAVLSEIGQLKIYFGQA